MFRLLTLITMIALCLGSSTETQLRRLDIDNTVTGTVTNNPSIGNGNTPAIGNGNTPAIANGNTPALGNGILATLP